MSNKTQLQTNNTNLDALITRVNAAKDVATSLPEAGSGGENLDAVIAEQQALINTLSAVLDNKAAGGGGGTCTVTIRTTRRGSVSELISTCAHTSLVDGALTYNFLDDYTLRSSVTFENVVCGSIMAISLDADYSWFINDYDKATFVGYMGYSTYPVLLMAAPAEAGVACNVLLDYDP